MISPRYEAFPIHSQLGEEFYDAVEAAKFPQHILRFRNQNWAEKVGLDTLSQQEWIDHFGRFHPLPENLQKPLALRYHGHQFRHYNPDLGDGRGFLFAQIKEPGSGKILDLGTKGSGKTPYSRTADGRLTLKGAVREALATEYLEALGVTTSKTFSIIETGEALERHDEPSPTRSAVLVRLSHSHIRFGSFQRLAFFEQDENLKKLLLHSCRYYFEDLDLNDPDLVMNFFKRVLLNSARLCAEWMISGFVHGVLNTDNLVVTGESFDYGPYRVLPVLDPYFTAAYFDHGGLYAYGRQPEAVYWNLHQLAFCLTRLGPPMERFQELLEEHYSRELDRHMQRLFTRRLWLKTQPDQEGELIQAAFKFLQLSKAPFEGFFFDWLGGLESENIALKGPRASYYQGDAFETFKRTLARFECRDSDRRRQLHKKWRAHPSLVIEEVERVWEAIDQNDDWKPFEEKIESFRQWASDLAISHTFVENHCE